MDYSKLIIRLRSKNNWKQSDLAKVMNVTVTTVNRWENKKNEPLAIQKVRLDDLFIKYDIKEAL